MAEYDDGAYYEVQLNNKQLVFFFMATLAIAVVVFLCGVMVGRGVSAMQPLLRYPMTLPTVTLTRGLRKLKKWLPRLVRRKPKPKLDYPDRLEAGKRSDEARAREVRKSRNDNAPVERGGRKPPLSPSLRRLRCGERCQLDARQSRRCSSPFRSLRSRPKTRRSRSCSLD